MKKHILIFFPGEKNIATALNLKGGGSRLHSGVSDYNLVKSQFGLLRIYTFIQMENSTLICQEIQASSCIVATFTVEWSL